MPLPPPLPSFLNFQTLHIMLDRPEHEDKYINTYIDPLFYFEQERDGKSPQENSLLPFFPKKKGGGEGDMPTSRLGVRISQVAARYNK